MAGNFAILYFFREENTRFLGILLFALGGPLGAPPDVRGFLYGACLSLGMLVGTFVYVLGDNLVSKALMSREITSYPRNLREGRQSLKACIIPAAVAVITLMFTFSITVLSLNKAGLDVNLVSRSAWIADSILLGVFFVVVVVLASVLKANAGTFFGAANRISRNIESLNNSIDIQADSMSKASAAVEEMAENITWHSEKSSAT